MATNNKKKQYTGTDYLHEVIQAVRDAKSAGVSGAQNISKYVNNNTSDRGQTYAEGAKRDYVDESRRNAQRERDNAAKAATKTAQFQKTANAITSQYTAAWNEMNSKLQKSSTSTGITAAGDIGAAATAVQKKATGQLGSSAMTGKSSLKAAVEDQSSKSRIPWTQPVTAQNVKVRTSKDKATEDNAKWANRAMQDAEAAMNHAIADKDSAAYQDAVEQYKRASEAYAESTAKVIQNENARQAQSDYVRRHASEDQGKTLAAQRDYASNMTDYYANAETDKNGNKLTDEQKSKYKQISEKYRKKYTTLQNLSQANDYYADSTSRITSMDDTAFQNLYTSYQEAKEQAEEYAQQAQEARKQAGRYLRTNTGMYNTLTALAEQYQKKADAAQAQADAFTGGDEKVAYAIENRGETTTLSNSARKDKNFEKYVELGEKSGWSPRLRGAMEGMLNQIGYMDTHSALLDEMTETEKDTLYYYVGKGDEDSAQQYFTAIEPSLEARRAETMVNKGKELVDEHPVLGTAANAFVATVSPVLSVGGVMENAVNAVENKMNGTYTPAQTNGILQAGSLANKATQLGVSQNLQRNFGISETSANFLSGTIVSMANNAAQFGLVGGGLQLNLAGVRSAFANLSGSEAARVAAQEAVEQAAKSINTWIPLALMSTGAATDTIREQLESGSDFGKALLYGSLCGAVEAWTEKIGVDSWVELASKGVKSGLLKGAWSAAGNIDRLKLQNVVKAAIGISNQALSEGGEEVISNVVDTILDVAINGEDSEFMQYRNNLIAQGYSASEAERKATIQFYVKNSGESFTGGALSGAVFGVFSIPANLQSNQRIGQAIIDSGTELDLVNDGLSYNTDTEVYQIASAIAKKLDTRNGYQPTAREITQLSVAMSEESQRSPSASITAQQLQDGGDNQLSTFATELQATGAVSGKEAIQANTVLMKAMDGETLTTSDIKALHAEIPAVREILSQKLGTTITTGSDEEVRNAVNRYVRDGNSAKTQAAAQKNAKGIIQDAKPYARQAALAETQSEVSALRQSAEAEAQTRIDAEDARLDTAAADQAADTTARIAEAAEQQATENRAQSSRDSRGNLNYKEFSEQYRAAHPEAGNSEITSAYDKANQEYRNKDTITIDGHEFTRAEVKELLRVRGVKATDAMVDQMFIDSIMQEQEGGEKPHYSLSDVEDMMQTKPQGKHSEAQTKQSETENEQKAAAKTEAESQSKDSHTKKQQQDDTGNDTTNDTVNDTVNDTEEAAADNSPAPSGKYSKEHPNKVAEWVSKEAEKALRDMGIENAQVMVDYEMDPKSNGYYVLKDGKRQIVLNGQLGGTTREGQVYSAQQNIQFIVAHELGHIVQGVGYTGETNQYTDQILNLYQEDTGTTDAEVEAGIQRVMDKYLAAAKRKDSGISLSSSDITWEYARGEYAADRLAEMLGQYNTLRKLVRKQNRNLIQKALDMVGGFRGALKTKLGSKGKANKASGLTWVGIAEIYDEAAGNLEKVLKESMEYAGKMRTPKEGAANIKRYTIDAARGIYVSDEDIQTGIQAVAKMEPVANISGDSFKKGDVDLTTQVAEFFKANGSVVVNEQVGSIVMDRRSAKDDIAHGIGRKKAAAFAAVPDVLRNGKVIDFQENWKNRGYQTAVIAAPINMDGEGYLMGAVIRRESGDARFYVHEVLTTQEGQAPFKTGTDSKAGGKSGGDYPSVVSLLQMVKDVKADGDSTTRYALNDDEGDLPELGEDSPSKFSRFSDTYEKGTALVGKSQSVKIASELKKEYSSGVDTQELATRYRQMSSIGKQLGDLNLNFLMNDGTSSSETSSQYTAVREELLELGREIADNIIDYASSTEQGDTTVYDYLRDRLAGEKVYVPDKIKQDIAMALQCESWNEARRQYFYVLSRTVNDASKGIDISNLYESIREGFPGAVEGGILARADQLKAIIDAYDSARDSREVTYNPLARSIAERAENRERIAEDIVSRIEQQANEYASQQWDEYSAAKKAEAARLKRQAAYQEKQAKAEQSEGRSGEAAQKQADALREQAAEATLMGQTDEETILEAVHDEGLGGEKAEKNLETTILSPEVIEWAKHSKELDKVVARMLQKKAKREQRQKMSKVRSNTFEHSEFFTEAELALDGMKKENFTYQVKSEAESFGEAANRLMGTGETFDQGEIEHQKQDMHEAANRLDSNYLHWYDTLPTKENWTGTDLDTAMMILNQIRTNDRETGDYRESSKWAKLIQERGTAGGQFIQAFAKWSRTPDGIIAKAVKHLDDTHLGKDINGKAIGRLNEENQQTFQQIGIEEQKNRALKEEYEQLQKEQNAVREMLRNAIAKNREADRSNDALYDKIDKELDKIVNLSKEIQTKEFENTQIQDVLDVLDGRIRTLTAKVSKLGTENTHIVTERDRLTSQLGMLEQRSSQLEQQIKAGQNEVAILDAAIEALREKNGVSEISLGEITKELQDILDGLKSDVADKAAQKGVLRKIVQGLMRTRSAEDIRNLVTKTTNQSLNDRWGRLMGDLLDNVSDSRKERIINDMTRIADMINAAESWQIAVNMGDKNAELKMRNRLIDCIMNACKTRGMKPSRKVEEMMRATFAGQTTEYLNQFARVSLANIADDYQKSSWGQKLSTWQYLAQLLNLRTSLRNVTSNAVFQGIDTGARNLAVPVDKFVALFTKKRTVGTSLRHGSDKSALRGATEQAGRAMLEVMLDVDMNNARSKYGEGARRTFKMCQQGIAGGLARNLSRLEMVNGISLNVTDEFFKGAIYQGTINSTAKLVEQGWITEEEAVQFATQDMLYRTFQDDTLVGTLLNKLHDVGNFVGVGHKRAEANGTYQKGKKVQFYTHDFGLGDLVIKYRGVPGALITRTVEFSPAGYLKALHNCIQLIQSGGTDTQAQRNFVLGVSRATTGSGLIALFWLLAAKGLLKRDDDEEDKNVAAMNRAEGQSGTQLNLSALDRLINGGSTDWESGDKLIDIGFLDPLSSDMTMGTLIYKAMQEDGATIPSAWSVAQGGMMSAAFSDLSMMDTINDAIYAAVYHDENSDLGAGWDFVITASASALSGFLPSLMRQAAQASDNYYRDAYGGGWIEDNVSGDLGAALQQGVNQLAMGIPGLRQTLPKKLDPLGNEKVYSPDGSTARNIANALVNPGKYSIYSQTSVSKELGRVRRLTGETSFYPDRNGPNSIIYGDEKVKLTDAQKRQYLQNAGSLFEELAAETMKTDAYKNATNERKAELLSEVKSYTEYKAKQVFYEQLHSTDAGYTPWETDTWSKTEAGMAIGVSFGEMRQIISDTSEKNMPSDYDENGETISGTRDGKILDYLNDLSYSDKQKLELYRVLKGSGSESSIQKMQNIMNAGLSFYEASKVKQQHTSIGDRDHSINNTDMNNHDYFTKWLSDEGFSESEIEAINENYPFYNQIRQQTDSILKRLTENGMDYDAAYEVANKVAAIEPEDGEDDVSSAQKYNVILDDYNMSTSEKQAAISAIAGDDSLFAELDEGAAQAMMELYERSGQTSTLSANAGTNYSVDGIQYDYTEEQQEAYNQAYIQIMNGISGSTISTAKVMDDIKDIAANAGKYAALQQSGENPDIDSSTYGLYRKAQQAMDTGLDVARYCEIKATCNSFTADKDSSGKSVSGSKKKKVVAYLKAQGLTSSQYSFFYSTIMGYK